MSLALTNKLNPSATTGSTLGPTANLTPVAGRVYVASVAMYRAAGTPNTVTCAGAGLTWTEVDNQTATNGRLTVFLSNVATGGETPGGITFTAGAAQTQDSWAGNIHEYDGEAQAGTVVQHPKNTGTGTTASVVLAAFADAVNNACVLITGIFGAGPAITLGAGFTLLGSGATGSPQSRCHAEYKIGEDLLADATWSGSQSWACIALEIAVAGAAGAAAGGAYYQQHYRQSVVL